MINERSTASSEGPLKVHFADHRCQNFSVSSSAADTSIARGTGRCEGEYVSTNGISSPAATSNSPTVRFSSPCSSTGVRSVSLSGPATACSSVILSCVWLTHGMIEP